MAVVIKAEKRDDKKNPRQVRAEGKLTATVYGKGAESVSLELNAKEFLTEYKKDTNATFSLEVEKKSMNVKVKDVQENYRTGEKLNVQFVLV
jgi:ribosomal protein L25 (general stress protein Ctc)